MGTVYLARCAADGLTAAIKFFPPLNSSQEEAIKEASAFRQRGEFGVQVLDAGVTPVGAFWIALEYVEGEDLRTRLERGAIPIADAAAIGAQLFTALDAIHRSGVAHGDIKPENVIVQPNGRIRIVDFGRARLHHLWGGAGVYPGTPPYMHPSLFHGGAPDPRTDVFAAWVTVFEMVLGERPYPQGTLRASSLTPLPRPRALPDPLLDRIVWSGLDGTFASARIGWLALARYLRGRRDLPRARAETPHPDSRVIVRVWDLLAADRSVALVGDADTGRAMLEALHREAESQERPLLWARADWGSRAMPLSGALGLAGHAADTFSMNELARIAEEIGPLGGVLAQRLPAARTWLRVSRVEDGTATDRLSLAIRRFIAACPRPLLVLVDRFDHLDGASRRLLNALVTEGELVVVGTSSPRGIHGLPEEVEVRAVHRSIDPRAPTEVAYADLLARAGVLELPFGPQLARAAGVSLAVVEDASLECEAQGSARWNGAEVLPRPAAAVPAEVAGRYLREAGRNLDPTTDALLVADYARRGGDAERLAEILDRAVAEAAARDPEAALVLLEEDHRPRTPERVLAHFHIAILARRMERASALLEELRGSPTATEGDLGEAEGELAFRSGQVVPALNAYRRVAAALGRPVGEGWRQWFELVRAYWRLRSGRRVPPRPDARLARIFERLHDLQFTHHHGPMLRIHELWLEAAPDNARARAMDVVWQTAFGWHDRARQLEDALLREMDEEGDPVGAALVLLHRAIARCWRGDTVAAYADAVEAADGLARAGDPYLAALASSTVSTVAIHVGAPEALKRTNASIGRLAALTGDARAEAWVQGGIAVWHWVIGNRAGAIEVARGWAEKAQSRTDSTEAAARRLLTELHVEVGDWRQALVEADRAARVIRRYQLQMDFYSAWVISALVADAQARLSGHRGLSVWRRARARAGMATLLGRSPRWTPRALAARGWQAVAAGDREGAARLFTEARADAEARRQPHDEWIVLEARQRALSDPGAGEEADRVARRHGLKGGWPT